MLNQLNPRFRLTALWAGTVVSALLCVWAPWLRGPGLELAGLTADWPLMWVVCWSVRRPLWQGAVAGLAMGMLQDSLSFGQPTHAFSLMVVGILTARLQKQRYMREDFISVALIVFGMVVVSSSLMALQWSLLSSLSFGWDAGSGVGVGEGPRSLDSIWFNHQRTTLTSAILSSLWAPALYLPLRLWWQQEQDPE